MKSQWRELFTEACSLIDHVNRGQIIIDNWTFGGGTAMMIQIDHRESHDVDLFVDDPQLLAYLNPAQNEFDFTLASPSYEGDGTKMMKLAFDVIGEIDFIVAGHITDDFARLQNVCGRDVQLETVPEIIAKKVNYRGSMIQPRDIFDIAAAIDADYGDAIKSALSAIPEKVNGTLACIDKLKPEYVSDTISKLMLRPNFEGVAKHATTITVELLSDV